MSFPRHGSQGQVERAQALRVRMSILLWAAICSSNVMVDVKATRRQVGVTIDSRCIQVYYTTTPPARKPAAVALKHD